MKASELKSDTKNFNRGTKRGRKMVADSLKDYGAGRSVLVDKDNRIIAGNKTVESAADMPIQIIETDGTRLIVVKRTDLSLDDKVAREMAISDNRSSEVGLDWDLPTLESFRTELSLDKFWKEAELKKLFGEAGEGDDDMPAPGYGVLIENISETQQLELLERLTAEGLTCKAMTF